MRTIWNGSISFGLVNIPIGLALATQRSDVSFRTLHRECGTPIKQKRWCPFHERDVEPDEIVKGWEVAKGEFVLVEESDLESVALQRSQSIEIVRFVKLEDVDPVYFDRTYYLAPAAADAARRPYVLLLRAMLEAKLAGEEIKRPEPVTETPVVDLMEALRKSVADAQERKSGKTKAASAGSGSRRKAPARKSA
jgi:Ku protein